MTPAEADVLDLITKEFLTIKKVAIRRKCSPRRIQKIVKSLKKKGHLGVANNDVRFFRGTCEHSEESRTSSKKRIIHQIRLHGQEFNITILFKDERYKEKIGYTIPIDGNTIRCYRDSIEVYSGQSFYADDVQKATARSMEYWGKLFIRLENDLKVILVKPRAQNIKIVNQHYAEINNELATECEKKAEKIRVYTTDEGKLWFMIDNSFNLREAETQGKTAKEDMQDVIVPFLNDLRDNKPPLPTELKEFLIQFIKVTQKQITEIAAAQVNTQLQLQTLVTSLQTILNVANPEKSKQQEDQKVEANYIG